MNHKKCLFSLLVLGLAAATAYATPVLQKPTRPAADRAAEGADEGAAFTSELPQPLTTFGVIQSTNFDDADGWDLGYSLCGEPFAGTCTPPGTGFIGNACGVKDHATSQNCCLDDPNETNGWFLNILSAHCEEPHIDNLHPSMTKPSGSQHLRFKNVAPVGTMACAGPAYGGPSCRFRIHTPPDRFPGNGQDQFGRSVYTFEIAVSQVIGNTRVRYLPGFHTEAPGGGGIYAYNGNGLSGVYFNFNGRVQVCRSVGCPDTAAGRLFLGYWSYDGGGYGTVTIDMDRCNSKLTISYKHAAEAVSPAIPGASEIYTTSVNSVSGNRLWVPPYNAGGNFYTLIDQIMFFKNNPPLDPTLVDVDNWKITHTACPDACCNANNSGLCDDTGAFTETSCGAAGGKYLPNVQCSQLGTPGYPPACSKDKGSCCNAGPGAGGACTDGVLEENCIGSQLTWTKNASCDPDGFPTLCASGGGSCSSEYSGHAAPHFCVNQPGFVPCTVNADCDVAGFCYAGQCTQPATSGTCRYNWTGSAGYCQTMGRCSGSANCNPDTGAGCCDPACPVACPAGQTCLVEPQDCDAVPGGADCAFCEGCSAWPANQGACNTAADCLIPADSPGMTATCEPNPIFVCNVDGDCPAGTTCQIPAVNPGAVLCTTDDVCRGYIVGAPACEEHTGACCEAVKGTCQDDVLSADCPTGTAAQMTWHKLTTCAAVEAAGDCDADLGACCDKDPFGGCTDTTFNGCPTAGTKNVWTKNVLCAELTVPCSHNAIPTVSEWGIVVLTLLLLVGAKVYFGRRQAATA